jgi:hypothetical protein
MKRRYGVYGLQFGLVLAALVIIGMYTALIALIAEAYPIDNAMSAGAATDSGAEWNALSIAGVVLSVLGLAHVVVLPLSMYTDTKFIRQSTSWQPLRILWIPLSAVPLVQLPVTIVYLLRRTYLLTVRPFLTGQQMGGESEAMSATDSPQPASNETVSKSPDQSRSSLGQRLVSSLENVLKTVFYVILAYFIGFGIAFGIGTLLGLGDTVIGGLALVLWLGSYWVLR